MGQRKGRARAAQHVDGVPYDALLCKRSAMSVAHQHLRLTLHELQLTYPATLPLRSAGACWHDCSGLDPEGRPLSLARQQIQSIYTLPHFLNQAGRFAHGKLLTELSPGHSCTQQTAHYTLRAPLFWNTRQHLALTSQGPPVLTYMPAFCTEGVTHTHRTLPRANKETWLQQQRHTQQQQQHTSGRTNTNTQNIHICIDVDGCTHASCSVSAL
eukprot:182601-Pelagomonas_calceolata.AAC.4